jgi:hypothetical protein
MKFELFQKTNIFILWYFIWLKMHSIWGKSEKHFHYIIHVTISRLSQSNCWFVMDIILGGSIRRLWWQQRKNQTFYVWLLLWFQRCTPDPWVRLTAAGKYINNTIKDTMTHTHTHTPTASVPPPLSHKTESRWNWNSPVRKRRHSRHW